MKVVKLILMVFQLCDIHPNARSYIVGSFFNLFFNPHPHSQPAWQIYFLPKTKIFVEPVIMYCTFGN